MTRSARGYESPQNVYAKHLSSRRGYPLWMPELNTQLPKDYRDHGLKIGDVGYVDPEEGCFEVLFNICLPRDDDLHRGKKLPRNFYPVVLEDGDVAIYLDQEAAGKVIKSTSVTTVGTSPEEHPSDYEFTFPSSEGALLILPQGADRYSLRRLRAFANYAKQHAAEWYRFVQEDLEQIISNDSLYLITGFYKARSWALAAFEEAEGSENIPARFKVTQSEGGAITRGYNWNTTRHSESRVGPSAYNGNPNQAVYIRGFKIAVRDIPVARKEIVVKAEHPFVQPFCEEFKDTVDSQESDTHGSGKSGEIGSSDYNSTDKGVQHTLKQVSLQRVPQASQLFHPSDIINQYLLQKKPSATVVITHDCQWLMLLGSIDGKFEPHELVDEQLVVKALSEKYAIALEDRVVFLRNGKDASDPLDIEDDIEEQSFASGQSLPTREPSSQFRAQPTTSGGRFGTTLPRDEKIESTLFRSYVPVNSIGYWPLVSTEAPKPEPLTSGFGFLRPYESGSRSSYLPVSVYENLGTAYSSLLLSSPEAAAENSARAFTGVNHGLVSPAINCQWVDNGAICGDWVTPNDIRSHLVDKHGIQRTGGSPQIQCKWLLCHRSLSRKNFLRHMLEVHFGHKRGANTSNREEVTMFNLE